MRLLPRGAAALPRRVLERRARASSRSSIPTTSEAAARQIAAFRSGNAGADRRHRAESVRERETARDDIRARSGDPVDWRLLSAFQRQMLVALDGLWFLNVLKAARARSKAFELDVRVFVSQFKKATRLWREMNGLDGKSVADKVSVFEAMARLYGHDFEVLAGDGPGDDAPQASARSSRI